MILNLVGFKTLCIMNNSLQKQKYTIKQLQQNFDFSDVINDENEVRSIDCNYYDMNEFKTMCNENVSKNYFSIPYKYLFYSGKF